MNARDAIRRYLARRATYHALWHELHTNALALSPDAFDAWLPGWIDRIPSHGCACQADARAWIKSHPPRGDRFVWTWRLHDFVNRKLKKPRVTLDDARRLYH